MKKILNLKPVLNKKNGQINFNLPRKKLSKEFFDKVCQSNLLKVELEDWD